MKTRSNGGAAGRRRPSSRVAAGAIVIAVACGWSGCKLRPAWKSDAAASRADAGAGGNAPRYDLAPVTVARVKSVGAKLGYQVIDETRDGPLHGYHERFVALGTDGKLDLLITLWDFTKTRGEGDVAHPVGAHQVGALQAISIYTLAPAPKRMELDQVLRRLLAGKSIDAVSVADLK